jgi:iron(III) transport system substrate-binding protein
MQDSERQKERTVIRQIASLTLVASLWMGALACAAPPTGAPPAQDASDATGNEPWRAEWNQLVAAARTEGEVIVWTGQPGEDARQVLKDEFEKAYPGIKVTLFQAASTSERDSRYLAELEAGVAKLDILHSGSGSANARLKPAGVIRDLRPFLFLPEVTDQSKWFEGRFLWADAEEMYVAQPEARVAYAAALHPSIAPAELTSWWDLLTPKFKGKIVMTDPRQSGSGFARSEFFFFTPELGQAFTSRFYGESGVVFSSDVRQNLEWVINGRMLVNISPGEREVAEAQRIGLPFQVIPSLRVAPDGKEANSFSGGSTAMFLPTSELPHPNAAKVFLNWYLSQRGQQAVVDIMEVPSLRTDVDKSKIPDALVAKPGVAYMHLERYSGPEDARVVREDVNRWLPAQ